MKKPAMPAPVLAAWNLIESGGDIRTLPTWAMALFLAVGGDKKRFMKEGAATVRRMDEEAADMEAAEMARLF